MLQHLFCLMHSFSNSQCIYMLPSFIGIWLFCYLQNRGMVLGWLLCYCCLSFSLLHSCIHGAQSCIHWCLLSDPTTSESTNSGIPLVSLIVCCFCCFCFVQLSSTYHLCWAWLARVSPSNLKKFFNAKVEVFPYHSGYNTIKLSHTYFIA